MIQHLSLACFMFIFSSVAFAQQKVVSLTLINADTDKDIGTLTEGMTLNLATLPTRNLSIRANTSPSTVGSVRFGYNGNSNFITENKAPYAIAGDGPGPNYYPWTPALNSNSSISATPYSKTNASGTVGTSLSLRFSVINVLPTEVRTFSLVDSITQKEIVSDLSNLQKIEIDPAGKCLNIRANTAPEKVGSVIFSHSGKTFSESAHPYFMFGDSGERGCLQAGSHTVRATSYELSGGSGLAGKSLERSFELVLPPPPFSASVTSLSLVDSVGQVELVSSISENQKITIDGTGKCLNIRAFTNPMIVGSVIFEYSGTTHLENKALYDMFGDSGERGCLKEGLHSVKVTPYELSSGGGLKGVSFVRQFEILPPAPQYSASVESFSLVDTTSGETVIVSNISENQTVTLDPSGKCLNIRANVSLSKIGSVKFSYAGKNHIENSAPYYLFGDSGERGCIEAVGDHTVEAIPYEASSAAGAQGRGLLRKFKISMPASTANYASMPPTSIPSGLIPGAWDLSPITGKEYIVSTLTEFNSALSKALPGDGILITAGRKNWGSVIVSKSGTSEKPIIIRSNGGPVIFEGSSLFRVSGSYLHFQGLSFINNTADPCFDVGGSSDTSRATGNRFSVIHCNETRRCFKFGFSHDTRVDHSLFEKGQNIAIFPDTRSILTRIDHNLFRDFGGTSSNGREAIMVGTQAYGEIINHQIRKTRVIVDHNVFKNIQGEDETVGVKSDGNIIAFNVFVDSPGKGHLSLRAGQNNLVIGNVLRSTKGGIRIFGIGQKVINNLVVNHTAWGGLIVPTGSDKAYRHSTTNDNLFVRYVASRKGLITNNSVVVTPEAINNVVLLGQLHLGTNCHPDGLITCDVYPFSNTFSRNALINFDGAGIITSKDSSLFASKNNFSSNLYGPSGTSINSAFSTGFSTASSTLVSSHDDLSSFVNYPSQSQCLRMNQPSNLESMSGAMFAAGNCEKVGEDNGVVFKDLKLMSDANVPMSDQQVIQWIKSSKPQVLPLIPIK